MEYIFELEMQVRDYECDMEGIVNNAIYQHYLEHTRHEFLASSGISFIEMHERGVDPVVNRIEINYKTPLRSRDKFISKLYMRRAVRQIQTICRISSCLSLPGSPCTRAPLPRASAPHLPSYPCSFAAVSADFCACVPK